VIVVAGLDAEQEVPILHLRLRKAAGRGAKIYVLHPRRTSSSTWRSTSCAGRARAERSLKRAPGDQRGAEEAGPLGVVIAGPRLADGNLVWSVAEVASAAGARFAYVSRRANDRGALVAGVHPALLRVGGSSALPRSGPRLRALGARSSSATKDGTGEGSCRRVPTGRSTSCS